MRCSVLLFDPQSWKVEAEEWRKWHRRWFRVCLLIAIAAVAWYVVEAVLSRSLPRGSSLPGLAAGGLAGLLFLYLCAYAGRKYPPLAVWFARRPTKYWLAQHIWLGLLTFPLVCLHTSILTKWGGPLPTILLVVYFVVFASGVWGLFLQQRLPRHLLQDLPDETIRSQIPELTSELRTEAELLVLATCGPPADNPTAGLKTLKEGISRVRAARAGRGTGMLRVLPAEPLPDTEPLRKYFHDFIDPYLREDLSYLSKLRLRARMESDFSDLRLRVNPAAHEVVDALRDLCQRRRQFDQQVWIHSWLHGWIVVHLSFSLALLILVVWHACSAIPYW
jgi:hypothetical protein